MHIIIVYNVETILVYYNTLCVYIIYGHVCAREIKESIGHLLGFVSLNIIIIKRRSWDVKYVLSSGSWYSSVL